MRITRRGFLKRTAALSFALAMGGIGASLNGCSFTETAGTQPMEAQSAGRGTPVETQSPAGAASSTPAASPGDYASLDPRNPDNFAGRLNLPRPDGGLFGILDVPSDRVDLTAGPEVIEILPGIRTEALAYRVDREGKTYLNPILRVMKGDAVSVRLQNRVGEDTIVHWHGLHVDWRDDGHPSYAIGNGQSYEYDFTVANRSATYWYHPHPHPLTGRQTYYGLASFFVVDDEEEQALASKLDLELGVTDLPLLIQDKRFDERGQLIYLTGGPMEQFTGFLGDVMDVNLSVNPSLGVSSRLYRFRLLNASNARTYRLALVKGNAQLPFYLIGTDGGLLSQPHQLSEVFLSPAERADVLLDLRDLEVGDVVFLKSLAFDPMHNEMGGMGGMRGSGPMRGMGGMRGRGGMKGMVESRLPEGEAFHVLKLMVSKHVPYDQPIPSSLAEVKPIDVLGAGRRPFELASQMMQWLINGRRFNMLNMKEALFTVQRGVTEIWEVKNVTASMPHPMHLHGFQFQVLERRDSPAQIRGLALDSQGRLPTDLGWKDTVLVWPGETVAIAASFALDFAGEQTYLFHCHNLEHEDQGMMVNYRVT